MNSGSQTVALIALGTNLGDSVETMRRAFAALAAFSREPVRCSSLWQSDPVDCPPGSPRFLNAAAAMVPLAGESPESLLAKLKGLEVQFGRAPKKVMNEARALDLDLIAFGAAIRSTPELTLPHPRAHLREFVLRPLAEVAPHFVWPGSGETIADLAGKFPDSGAVRRCV